MKRIATQLKSGLAETKSRVLHLRSRVRGTAQGSALKGVLRKQAAPVWAVVTAFTVAVACALIVLALGRGATQLADAGGADLQEAVSIEITTASGDTEALRDAVLSALGDAAGVSTARLLSMEEQATLLAPWFGTGLEPENFPMPDLIAVAVSEEFDVEQVRADLRAVAPDVILRDHREARHHSRDVGRRLNQLGWGIGLVLVGAVVAGAALLARVNVQTNASHLQVLRDVGATDSRMVAPLQRRMELQLGAGVGLGFVLAVATLAMISNVPYEPDVVAAIAKAGSNLTTLFLSAALIGVIALILSRAVLLKDVKEL